MDRDRTLRSLGLALVAALMLLGGVLGCSLSDLLPGAGGEAEVTFWASEEVLPPGGCTMLHWEVTGAGDSPVFLDGREVPPEGDDEVCLDQPTTFELVVGAPGGSIRETVTIEVEGEWQEPPPGEEPPAGEEPPPEEPPPGEPSAEGGPEHVMLVVDPDAIPQGGCAMLHWEVAPGEWPVFINGQEVPPVGEREECPEATTTYELGVEAPGGPYERVVTLHVEGGGEPQPPAAATATSPPPAQPTATQPPPAQPTATQPPPAQPTATPFVARWGQCSWVGVEQAGIKSHQRATWCSNGSFLAGLDLDRIIGADAMDSPGVGAGFCCPLSAAQVSPWGQCSWVGVEQAGINSHQPAAWCPNGQYLAALDLDRIATDAMDSPGVGAGFCCPLGDPKYTGWGSCAWVKVHPTINSHQPVTWCPNGSFLVGLDLDREGTYDAMDSPVVGQAYCCSPQ
jgi:hypothetical protein